jgi:glycerol-3-phosphate dehydrogenase
MTVKQATAQMKKNNKTVEGFTTILILRKLCTNYSVYPFLLAMQEIILKNKNPRDIIKNLIEAREI